MPAAGARFEFVRALGRAAMLFVYALVLWGALLFASTLANAVREGPAVAFGRLLPAPGASLLAWVGSLSVAMALLAGLLGGFLLLRNRAATRA